jgi:UDP-GlcNAc:undecaprenyl-phosphate GlcNAc-1-phosphate transferase
MQGLAHVPGLAFALALVVTPLLRHVARRLELLDVPNERSSHRHPTPRTGGIAICAGLVAGAAAYLDRPLAVVLGATVAMAVVGLVDDLRGLPARVKLVAQLALGGVAVAGGGLGLQAVDLPGLRLPLGPLAFVAAVVWITAVTNAFNFMDGINGIAGLHAMVCGGTLAALALERGDLPALALALALAAAAAGFLPWNFPSGSIFMGDVGSASLGFLLGSLVLREAQVGGSFLRALLPLLPFLLDTGATLVRRAGRRERLFEAHRTHYYQRLCSLGFSHPAVTAAWTILALLGAAGSLLWPAGRPGGQLLLIGLLLAVHATLAGAIALREKALARA